VANWFKRHLIVRRGGTIESGHFSPQHYKRLSYTGKILVALIEKGPMSYLEISRASGIPKSAVIAKFTYLRRKKFVEKINQKTPYLWKSTVSTVPRILHAKSNGLFSKSPSPPLAYVLGVCFGDACVIKYRDNSVGLYRYIVSLEVPEEKLAVEFRYALENIRLNPSFSFFAKKKTYRVRVYSRPFYEWFHGLTIAQLGESFKDDHQLAKEFIRGFYESEGCLSKIIDRSRPNAQIYQLIMGSTNKAVVGLIYSTLKDMGFSFHFGEFHHPNPNAKTLYRLRISRREEIRHFIDGIKPCIKNSFPN
jgi:intein-encoded DNA endonuclease-like protein